MSATGRGAERQEADFRLGRWEDVLADVEHVDCLITDPPYGATTHDGQARDLRSGLGYECWTHRHVEAFVDAWVERVCGWMACFTSDDLIADYRGSYETNGRKPFAPVPALAHKPRLRGDGPGSGAVYLMTARPHGPPFSTWGSLPCWYTYTPARGTGVVGAKPVDLMRQIIRDYTRPGDLVCDPCAGSGTTLIAAHLEGRRAIGAEVDPETHAKALERLAYAPESLEQPSLFGGAA